MGTLVAMRYPTMLALGAADHTYVKCANGGKAWSCWGGKSGGTELRRGEGSTLRADAIAGHDEKAGIRCYLVNGVCHQCANRILLPANLTVRGARGYRISEARFGVYGRPKGSGLFRHCVAPFNQFPGVTGDLRECLDAAPGAEDMGAPPYTGSGPARDPDADYLARVKEMYGARIAATEATEQFEGETLVEFMVALFNLRLQFAAGLELAADVRARLLELRVRLEREEIELEENLGRQKLAIRQFADESDRLTLDFQKGAEGVLSPRDYTALFELQPGEYVRLADPQIIAYAYGQR